MFTRRRRYTRKLGLIYTPPLRFDGVARQYLVFGRSGRVVSFAACTNERAEHGGCRKRVPGSPFLGGSFEIFNSKGRLSFSIWCSQYIYVLFALGVVDAS